MGDPPDRKQLDDAPKGAWKDEPPDEEVPDDLVLYDLVPDDAPDSSWGRLPCMKNSCTSKTVTIVIVIKYECDSEVKVRVNAERCS